MIWIQCQSTCTLNKVLLGSLLKCDCDIHPGADSDVVCCFISDLVVMEIVLEPDYTHTN